MGEPTTATYPFYARSPHASWTPIGDAVLLFIFGAGASHDSWSDKAVSDKDGRIPLSDGLFDLAYSKFVTKHLKPILPFLRQRLDGSSVERRLEELSSERTQYPERVRQLMAVRWYLFEMLGVVEGAWVKETSGVSNYRTLVDELGLLAPSERIAFVTFNYDTLLERAISSDTPRALSTVEAHARPDERINVFKLHGSLGWWRRVETGEPPSTGLRFRRDIAIEAAPTLKVLDEWTNGVPANRELAVPALAIPLEAKQDYECPPSHIDLLRDLLPSVDQVISVGWRATDEPFLELLRAHATSVKRIGVVARANADDPLARLGAALPSTEEAEAFVGGFSHFILRRDLKRLLRRD